MKSLKLCTFVRINVLSQNYNFQISEPPFVRKAGKGGERLNIELVFFPFRLGPIYEPNVMKFCTSNLKDITLSRSLFSNIAKNLNSFKKKLKNYKNIKIIKKVKKKCSATQISKSQWLGLGISLWLMPFLTRLDDCYIWSVLCWKPCRLDEATISGSDKGQCSLLSSVSVYLKLCG